MKSNITGWILVCLQFLCLGLLFGYPLASPESTTGIVIFYAGIALGLWALVAMPPASLTVHPKPREGGSLAFKGPYQWIRHPMYAAVLIVYFAQLLDYPSPKNLSVYAVLCMVLVIKIYWEEKWLIAKYADFIGYQQKTRKLIPFVW